MKSTENVVVLRIVFVKNARGRTIADDKAKRHEGMRLLGSITGQRVFRLGLRGKSETTRANALERTRMDSTGPACNRTANEIAGLGKHIDAR